MGHGSYKASDWEKLKNSRGINSQTDVSGLFAGNNFNEKYDPKFINVRESRDSDDSPNSTPIILAFDVTGSMGYLAAEIGRNSLNKTAIELYDKQPVTNPHIMCAAITQPVSPGGLQVTQFEADIRVVEQLLDLKVGFGGNRFSFDSLVWYFAAKHTSIDCYEKRGKKGFLFTIGDEVCGYEHDEMLTSSEIKRVFDDAVDEDYSLKEMFKMASEKYEVFHIVVGRESSLESWKKFMPGRVACVYASDVQYLSEVITTIMKIYGGTDKEEAIKMWPGEIRSMLLKSLENIYTNKKAEKLLSRLFGR